MKQILKRLELIKTSIDLDDEEIIELQVIKLEKLDLDSEVKDILLKIENLDYGSARVDIDNYIRKYTGVIEYIDPEMQGLKLEMKSLERKLQDLSELKNEYLNDIDEFHTFYNLKLGSIIEKILKQKEQLIRDALNEKKEQYQKDSEIYQETKETIAEINSAIDELEKVLEEIDEEDESYDEIYSTYQELKDESQRLQEQLIEQEEEIKKAKAELDDDPLNNEYENAKSTYEEFSSEYEDIKQTQDDVCDISDKDKKELKKLFRKASKLCHPDIVADEFKEHANEIMQSLNDAYSKKDTFKP